MRRQMALDAGVQFLRQLELQTVGHSRRTLLDHLVSTSRLLSDWGCSETICLAGLFHSIYGTESFQYEHARHVTRENIRSVIGVDAERLAWLFGMGTKESIWRGLRDQAAARTARVPTLTHRVTGEQLQCADREFLGLACILVANALDQAVHLPERYRTEQLIPFERLLPLIPAAGANAFREILASRSAS